MSVIAAIAVAVERRLSGWFCVSPGDPFWKTRWPRLAIWLSVLASILAILLAASFDGVARGWVGTSSLWPELTRLGRTDWLLVPSGLLALALYWQRNNARTRHGRDFGPALDRLLFIFAAIALTGIAASLVKNSLGFPRPKVDMLYGVHPFAFTADFASFPSGHSTTAGALAAVGSLLLPGLRVPFWLLAVAIGLSRIMLQAHHLSDVVAGLAFGGWGTILVARAFARHNKAFDLSDAGWPKARHLGAAAFLLDLVLAVRLAVTAFSTMLSPSARRGEGATLTRSIPSGYATVQITPASQVNSLDVSVVIPAKDEADNLAVLIPEIVAAMKDRSYEVIVVDDGSSDGTGRLVAEMKGRGLPVRHIRHELPCGQSAAVRTGMLVARGSLVATIDGDGQNDPAYIPSLVDALTAAGPAFGIAAGQRLKRTDGFAKKCASKFANGLRDAILKDKTRDSGCGLKVVRRDLFLLLPFFHGWHRYLPALVLREGFDVTHVEVVDRPRLHGKSNYGIFDRGLQGVLDLYGVWWLKRRIKRLPVVSEIE